MAFLHLILSCSSCFSTLLIMVLTLLLISFLFEFSLALMLCNAGCVILQLSRGCVYCCVRQCGTSFYILMSLGVIALNVYLFLFCTEPTQFLLIFRFTVLHSLRWNYVYCALSIVITDPVFLLFVYLFTTQLHSNLELQFSTYLCLV